MTWANEGAHESALRPRPSSFARQDTDVVARITKDVTASAGSHTPLSAYAVLADRFDGAGNDASDEQSYQFLLESGKKARSSDPEGEFAEDGSDSRTRFSFIGYDPEAVLTVYPDRTDLNVLRETSATEALQADADIDGADAEPVGDVLDRIRAAFPDVEPVSRTFEDANDQRQRLDGGFVGFLAYDAVYDIWLEESDVTRPDAEFPDAQFVLTTKTLVFDHVAETVTLVFTPVIGADDDPAAVYDRLTEEATTVETCLERTAPAAVDSGGFEQLSSSSGPQDSYEEAVRAAKEHILDGDIYQGVISRSKQLTGDIDPRGFYAALREQNPSPYMYLLSFGDRSVVGASPETLATVRRREGRQEALVNPIAGTCSRGATPSQGELDPVEDRRLAGEMLADEKERAEHTMLVDLARNDLHRVCEAGTVHLDEFMNVIKYSHVQHIESQVVGELGPETDAYDVIRATFPAGTLTGAPKIRAMEIIDALETDPREIYGGGIGYFNWTGEADFGIVIRTATVEHGDPDTVTVRAGAGIVADSDPEAEFRETEQKMDGVIAALESIRTPGPADTSGGDAE
jgi:anthranilate synthase component 1